MPTGIHAGPWAAVLRWYGPFPRGARGWRGAPAPWCHLPIPPNPSLLPRYRRMCRGVPRLPLQPALPKRCRDLSLCLPSWLPLAGCWLAMLGYELGSQGTQPWAQGHGRSPALLQPQFPRPAASPHLFPPPDVNECLQVPPPCAFGCRNLRGSYECLCPPGKTLLPGGDCGTAGADGGGTMSSTPRDPPLRPHLRGRSFYTQLALRRVAKAAGLGARDPPCPTGFVKRNGTCTGECASGKGFAGSLEAALCLKGSSCARCCPVPPFCLYPCLWGRGLPGLGCAGKGRREPGCPRVAGTGGDRCFPTCLHPSHPADLDECQMPNQCQHKCRNSLGSYRCICPPGYQLLPNGKACHGQCGGAGGVSLPWRDACVPWGVNPVPTVPWMSSLWGCKSFLFWRRVVPRLSTLPSRAGFVSLPQYLEAPGRGWEDVGAGV